MSTSTWTGAVNSDWDDADNWSPAGVPDASSDVVIAAGAPVAVASASIGTVNSITDLSGLRFRSAGTNTVTTFLDNSGELRVDRKAGGGGTILNIAGPLTNSGSLRIGNATLSASDEVTAASIDNTGGGIRLLGSSANQALLDVTGSAGFGTAEVLSGYVWLTGDSAIEFASGQITSLAAHAQLHLNGNDAFIEDSTELGSNSALTGFASIGAAAYFELENGASVSTTGALANDGQVDIDTRRGDGGSSLTVAGTLTNSRTPHTNNGDLRIGNATLSASDKVKAAALDNTGAIELRGSSANQALLDVTGAAGFGTAGVLSGNVALSGDSAIEFASGQITSLAAGAVFFPYGLSLNGSDAFIEDSTALGSNSALTGLASIGQNAALDLENGAAVSTTGALVNDGCVELDPNYNFREGRSSLNIGGTLTNSGALLIGNFRLSASDKVTAAALDNANTGNIDLAGSGANQALLDVTAGGAGFGTAGVLERQCSARRRQRDRVCERADQHDRCRFVFESLRKRRLDRGQHGARLEQRPDWARLDRRRGDARSRRRRLGVDDRLGHQQRPSPPRLLYLERRLDPFDRRRADQHRQPGYRLLGPFLVRLRHGEFLRQ